MENVLLKQQTAISDIQEKVPVSFEIFGALWAIAILFHIAAFDTIDNSFSDFLLGFIAVFYLNRLSSISRFVMLACFQVYIVAESMPFVPNHWIFIGFVNLTK
jgi:hypothetical protein